MTTAAISNLELWCRDFPAGATPQTIAARGKALADVADAHALKNVDQLLRLAFGLSVSAIPTVASDFRTALRASDSTFAESGNDWELQVMAAAVVQCIADSGRQMAAQVASRCLTLSFGGLRSQKLPVDLVAYAQQRVEKLGSDARERVDIRKPWKSGAPTIKAGEVAEEELDAAGVNVALATTAENATNALKTTFTNSGLLRTITVMDEELQTLWWLTNDWSESRDRAFGKVPKAERAMVFGWELSGQTEIFPEPRNLKALLHRAGVEAAALDIVKAVNHLDQTWAQKALEGKEPNEFVTPLHYALKRRLEADNDDGWGRAWAKAVLVPEASTLPGLDLGAQMYRESCILKAR